VNILPVINAAAVLLKMRTNRRREETEMAGGKPQITAYRVEKPDAARRS
jgi:hypothetical protein